MSDPHQDLQSITDTLSELRGSGLCLAPEWASLCKTEPSAARSRTTPEVQRDQRARRIFAHNLQCLTVISLWSGWLVVFAALLWRPPIPEARRPALDLSGG
jgi:hypothetical protein